MPNAPTMYPLDPASVSGNTISADTLVNQPTRVNRFLTDYLNLNRRRFLLDLIFDNGGGMSGGAIIYESQGPERLLRRSRRTASRSRRSLPAGHLQPSGARPGQPREMGWRVRVHLRGSGPQRHPPARTQQRPARQHHHSQAQHPGSWHPRGGHHQPRRCRRHHR